MQLRFWGVRGSIAAPEAANLGYGGNTPCIELRTPDGHVVVIDAGTGARRLGVALAEEFHGRKLAVNCFLTHFHSDHIQGLPFFAPLYGPSNEVIFYSGSPADHTRRALEGQMVGPYFPIPFTHLAARKEFVQIQTEPVRCGSVSVRAFPMHHPQGATGYRLEVGDVVIVHASDLEHGDATLDAVVRDHAQDADLLIYDSQYTPAEYEGRRGWGHSTWLEATRVARDARVGQLILFHHDPAHDDRFIDALVGDARRHFENTDAAREGSVLSF